jgi:hypothetical protein
MYYREAPDFGVHRLQVRCRRETDGVDDMYNLEKDVKQRMGLLINSVQLYNRNQFFLSCNFFLVYSSTVWTSS